MALRGPVPRGLFQLRVVTSLVGVGKQTNDVRSEDDGGDEMTRKTERGVNEESHHVKRERNRRA